MPKTLRISLFSLLGLWIVAILALGGVAERFQSAYLLILSLLSIPTLIWTWKHASEEESWPKKPALWVVISLLGIGLLMLFQLTPLPDFLLGLFSPLASQLKVETLRQLQLSISKQTYSTTLNPSETWSALSQLLGLLILFGSTLVLFQNRIARKWMVYAIPIIAAVVAFVGMIHRFSGSQQILWVVERGVNFFGPFVSQNHAGSFLAVAGALTFGLASSRSEKVDRPWFLFLFGVISLGLLFTGSRSALLALAVPIGLFLLLQRSLGSIRRQALYVLGSVIGLALVWQAVIWSRLLSSSHALFSGTEFRIQVWEYALALFAKAPLLGIGFGSFATASPMVVGDQLWLHPEHAENDFLELLACGGILGLFAVGYLGWKLFVLLRNTLKDPEASPRRQAFALGLVALSISSLFVFNAPLPSHQILFVLLTAALLAPTLASPRSQNWFRWLQTGVVGIGIVWGAVQVTHFAGTTPAVEPTLESAAVSDVPTLVEVKAHRLVKIAEAESLLIENPVNPKALYQLALGLAETDQMDAAITATGAALQMNPFDLSARTQLARLIGRKGRPKLGLELTEKLLLSSAPLGSTRRHDLLIDCALYAVLLNDSASTERYLEQAEEIKLQDWRSDLLRARFSDNPTLFFLKSWQNLTQERGRKEIWDQAFIEILKQRGKPYSLQPVVDGVGPERSDLGLFLARLRFDSRPIDYAPLFAGNQWPTPTANTPVSASNAFWEDPHTVRIRVKQAQKDLDVYWLPLDLDLSPNNLSFRMIIQTPHILSSQLLIRVGDRPFLTREQANRMKEGRWELLFSRVGDIVPEPLKKKKITGIGFTPLERDGRYRIEWIEAFVDLTR